MTIFQAAVFQMPSLIALSVKTMIPQDFEDYPLLVSLGEQGIKASVQRLNLLLTKFYHQLRDACPLLVEEHIHFNLVKV